LSKSCDHEEHRQTDRQGDCSKKTGLFAGGITFSSQTCIQNRSPRWYRTRL